MKFRVTLKDPDTLDDAIDDALEKDLALIADEEEREAVGEVRREKISTLCGKWFEYGEYLEVEIDTEAKTIVVIPVNR